jgi:single-strand DNA-binding protein
MYQSTTIVGRLGRDPEMRYLDNGQPVTSFSVATDRKYSDGSGQQVKETTWFRISVFGKQAESCNQYLKKGSMALIEGRLQIDSKTGGPRVWTRQDGTSSASFEIVANTVRFLSSRGEGSGAAGGGDYAEMADTGEGDIPF